MKQLSLTSAQLADMRTHVEASLPLEACGLLAGLGPAVQRVIPVANAAHSPARFRMDPLEQLRAFDQMARDGMELVGIYHSHPAGPETPSATDLAEAAYEVVYLIWARSGETWKARGFWIRNGRASEVKLEATGSES